MSALMTQKKWEGLKRGYGLQEIPEEIKGEVCCCECPVEVSNRQKLYTDQSISFTTQAELRRVLDKIRDNRVWCRFHAEWFFKEV
jgi:hypothetical protein